MRSLPLRAALATTSAALFLGSVAHAYPQPEARPRWPGVLRVEAPHASFHHFGNRLKSGGSEPWHRAQDVMVRAGNAAWVEARFAYGMFDSRLGDEDVDVYMRRSDSNAWQLIGHTHTADKRHPVLRGDGSQSTEKGLVAFRIPDGEHLPLGLNAIRFVVRGDASWADVMVGVVAPNARVVVSDVDGTLTEREHAFGLSVAGLARTPTAHPGAAALLGQLASRGYTVVYLTARPDVFSQATRTWLARNGFPPGLVRTREGTHLFFGGPDGVPYKTDVLRGLAHVIGHSVDIGFGNTITDVRAYEAAAIPVQQRFFYRYAGDARGGVHHDDYRTLAGRFGMAHAG
jgi:hypothetical protein